MKTKASKIKLLEIQGLSDGTRRFQSQLLIGKSSADFIMNEDNVMKCFRHGRNGYDFYPFEGEYEIVCKLQDMIWQSL